MPNEKSHTRLTAGALKNSKPSRLAPIDRSGRAVAVKKQVKGIRFTTPK
jgi:hypothetical protein